MTSDSALDAVYICYWSLRDPLCQSQSLTAVQALAKAGYRMALITYEQDRYRLDKQAMPKEHARLGRMGIQWMPLRYHSKPPLLSTIYDVLHGIFWVSWLVLRKKVRLLHTRGTVPALVALGVPRPRRVRFFYDADGPLSEEYADIGHWSRGGIAFRWTRWAERRCFDSADQIAVLTESWKRQLPDRKPAVEVLPCAVDLNRFRFDPRARESLRREHGWTATVFIYAGKYGGWYLHEQMIQFFCTARVFFPDARLVILTKEDNESFRSLLQQRELNDVSHVLEADHEQVPSWLSAADIGLSFFLPAPAVRARSPVKNGEYLACGLPVVTTAGIGDYSDLIAREKVGVVIAELNINGYKEATRFLKTLVSDPQLRERCREVATRHVSLDLVVSRYLNIYRSELG